MRSIVILISFFAAVSTQVAIADEIDSSLERATADANEWELPDFKVVFNEGDGISVTDAGILQIGKRFPDRLASIDPGVRQSALDFILLHELRHLHQQATMRKTFDDPESRPLVECMADIEAARALIAGNIASLDLESKADLKKALTSLNNFLDARPDLVEFLPEKDGASHLTKRERVLAMQFGLWRAYAERLETAPEKYKKFAADIARKAGLEAKPKGPWDITMCKRILGSDKEAIRELGFGFADTPDKEGYFGSAFSVRNNSHRDISVYMTFLTGFHPEGKDEAYEQFTFVDSSSQSVTLKPDEEIVIEASLPIFSGMPEGAKLFVWNTQIIFGGGTALVGAQFTGEFRLPPSCQDYFNVTGDQKTLTFADMARVGGYANDRFNGLWKKSYDGFGMDIVRPLTIPVRGVAAAEVYLGLGEPSVVLSLYEGKDKNRALAVFREWSDAANMYCPNKKLIREWTSDDELPNLNIERLTPHSNAALYVSEPREDNPNYQVGWRITYAR